MPEHNRVARGHSVSGRDDHNDISPGDDHGSEKKRPRVYFVRGGLPGDVLTCRELKKTSSYTRGVMAELITSGPYRTLPAGQRCKISRQCGGCSWMEAGYPQQLVWKKQILMIALEKHFSGDVLPRSAQIAVWSCDDHDALGYRSRVQIRLHICAEGSSVEAHRSGSVEQAHVIERRAEKLSVQLGFFAPGTRSLVPLHSCPVATPLINKFIAHLLAMPPEICFQKGASLRTQKMVLHIQEMDSCHDGDWGKKDQAPWPVSVMIGAVTPQDSKPTEEILAWIRQKALWVGRRGEESPLQLWDRDNHAAYFGAMGGFFQSHKVANRQLRSDILARVLELGSIDSVYDVFCGNGNLSLSLIAHGLKVCGVEESEVSAKAARESLRRLQIRKQPCSRSHRESSVLSAEQSRSCSGDRTSSEDSYYVVSRANRDAKKRVDRGERFDLIILNPPRSGAGDVLPYLSPLCMKHLFYVSCYPMSLAGDLAKIWRTGDWETIELIKIYDFYPHTPHFETWVHLKRKAVS